MDFAGSGRAALRAPLAASMQYKLLEELVRRRAEALRAALPLPADYEA